MPVAPSSRSTIPRPGRTASHRHHRQHLGDGQHRGRATRARRAAAQQDHRRDGPRPRDQRRRQRKDRGVVGASLGLGLALAPLRPPLEQHVERGQEQKRPAGDAERRHRDADEAQDAACRTGRTAPAPRRRSGRRAPRSRAARRSCAPASARRTAAPARSGRSPGTTSRTPTAAPPYGHAAVRLAAPCHPPMLGAAAAQSISCGDVRAARGQSAGAAAAKSRPRDRDAAQLADVDRPETVRAARAPVTPPRRSSSFSCAAIHSASALASPSITSAYLRFQTSSSPPRPSS